MCQLSRGHHHCQTGISEHLGTLKSDPYNTWAARPGMSVGGVAVHLAGGIGKDTGRKMTIHVRVLYLCYN